MFGRAKTPDDPLAALSAALASVRPSAGDLAPAVDRLSADAAAAAFHAGRSASPGDSPALVAVVGGTGTGKSTLVNRLLGRPAGGEVTASSFRRTFTAGPVAVARSGGDVPDGWLGVPHRAAESLPPRGVADVLTVVALEAPLLASIVLVDTPDLDGDRPEHHAQADRAFRWADAAVFVVTPEKYQMTELPPYYALAARYGTPSLFVMNKADGPEAADDYADLLRSQISNLKSQISDSTPFTLPRDDAAYAPDRGLDALRDAVSRLRPPPATPRRRGCRGAGPTSPAGCATRWSTPCATADEGPTRSCGRSARWPRRSRASTSTRSRGNSRSASSSRAFST